MKKLLIDINIVLDLLAKRDQFYHGAASLFSMADKGKVDLAVSALTFANTNYVLTKMNSAQEARKMLRRFKVLVEVLSRTEKIVEIALSDDGFKDFEDGLQHYSALEYGCDIIITRDMLGFKNSKLPVMTAEEYLSSIDNHGANG